MSDIDTKSKLIDSLRDHHERISKNPESQKIFNELLENASKMNESESSSKVGKVMNIVIVLVAIVLFFATIYIQSGKNKTFASTSDLVKEM